jgi:hypothetical protein
MPADDVDEDVLVADDDTAVAVQDREQHRKTILFQPDGDAARIRKRRRIDERLHFDQESAACLRA